MNDLVPAIASRVPEHATAAGERRDEVSLDDAEQLEFDADMGRTRKIFDASGSD
jgi:hypothetical protein